MKQFVLWVYKVIMNTLTFGIYTNQLKYSSFHVVECRNTSYRLPFIHFYSLLHLLIKQAFPEFNTTSHTNRKLYRVEKEH